VRTQQLGYGAYDAGLTPHLPLHELDAFVELSGHLDGAFMVDADQLAEGIRTLLADEPPVLCDWLPWNHTFGGNHNVGITLYNGGTLYIDEGKPLPGVEVLDDA
jgi:acyl-CoA synthetase (AMP-forming)/AMP-acid ligase II